MFSEVLYRVGLTPKKYFLKYVLPALIISIILTVIGIMYFTGFVRLLVLLIPVLILISTIGYPFIELDSQKIKINEKLHIFITKFGVLSITDLNRKELIRILAFEEEELGQLSEEARKIYVLMRRWNQSLADACRFLAQRTPSSEFADFLDRMAYSLDSGEDLKDFLIREQDIVMNDYAEFYKRALYDLDVFKEIYISVVTSLAFIVTFAVIVPFIIHHLDFVTATILAVFLFIVAEIMLVYWIKNIMPSDRLWHTAKMLTAVDRKLRRYLIISIVLTILSLVGLLGGKYIAKIPELLDIPYQILVALGFTPLFLAGYMAKREENLVIRKEFNFPGFLRSLGSSVSAKGGGMLESLKYLTSHDFGPLTEDLKRLYKRVAIRIDDQKAWRLFGIETCSYLIQLFAEMFERCVFLGGDAGKAAEIIGKNFRKIINLRKSKYQSVEQFTAIAYGLAGGLAFALYTSYGIACMINDLYQALEIPETMMTIITIMTPEDLSMISYLIYGCLLIYSLISAYLIKITDGGHPQVLLYHFVIMVWISSLVSVGAELLVTKLLSVNIPVY